MSKAKGIIIILSCLIGFILFFALQKRVVGVSTEPELWQIRSIDTMKTSRDKAREQLYNRVYDNEIQKELRAIKDTGANYVAIDTPYDEEFLPYLKRWVSLARKNDLKVWFRGNWSAWEGWFDYPKNMTPAQHLVKTHQFILDNPWLFEDGDIFDSCPECENAGHWEQPLRNKEYNEFIRNQQKNLREAFAAIRKNVYTNMPSIIGGRAMEVLDNETVAALDRVVTIDHYVKSSQKMSEDIEYLSTTFKTKVVISEFGAPIPDINGSMNEEQQAQFINEVFEQFYRKKDKVIGVNYYVNSGGSTPLLNSDYSPRKAYSVIKDYYSPGVVVGIVTNSLGDPLVGIKVETDDKTNSTITDAQGRYSLVIPPRSVQLTALGNKYKKEFSQININESRSRVRQDFILVPQSPDLIYKARIFIHNLKHRNKLD